MTTTTSNAMRHARVIRKIVYNTTLLLYEFRLINNISRRLHEQRKRRRPNLISLEIAQAV